MSSSYRLELDKWLSQLDVKATNVLDIGGAQLPVKGRTKSWDVKEYVIADLPEPQANSPKPDVELDLNHSMVDPQFNKELIKLNKPGHWELIFCLEVFDYIWNPENAFRIIEFLLAKNGTAWISFPSIYPLHQPVEDDALRYMPAGIIKLAENFGLSVENMIKRRPETNLFEQFYRAERMRAAKHEDHEFTGFIVEFKK